MKAGLEVHQQLATGKLFCDCPTELSDEVRTVVVRELRATGGENHHVDAAAAFQASRGLRYRYEAVGSSCLVELDEEPPHALNPDAVDVALTMARLLHARTLDEIEVMRKIVVDGSNTSGFQRTALVAVDGYLEVRGRRYSILSVCLEEDAARKVSEKLGEVTYRLDRLGIPLIEVATGPEITEGAEAREVAGEIGAMLRSTGRVRRGIGTIREDLNVSAVGGARVEIKGVQELRLISRYVETEEERQQVLLAVRDTLRARKAAVPDAPPVEVTELIRDVLDGPAGATVRAGGTARAIPLRGFAGTLKPPGSGAERLGRELADQARSVGLRGLLHSDELPGYGVDAPRVDALRDRLGLHAEDAFVLVVAPSTETADRALRLVAARARQALEGIPGETRDPLPDGRTRYSRPLPGRDRMYPETDVPPIPVSRERLDRVEQTLPENPEARRQRLEREYGLSQDLLRQLDRGGTLPEFESLVARGHAPGAVARLLSQDLHEAENSLDRPADAEPTETVLHEVLAAVEAGTFAKEGIPPVLRELLKGAPSVSSAIEKAGVGGLSPEALRVLAERVVDANLELCRTRGADAFSGLMGELMREVRGRRDGKEVAHVLRAAIAARAPPVGDGR
ncbi:MAG: Glu-tRNA(Gln) amidotransferase subunit GatE [Thermoplasmata archaeon]|nr:Glu-tRNA(Gln) amidotransferase subunit GatE [Thermoplasmata archaeon]